MESLFAVCHTLSCSPAFNLLPKQDLSAKHSAIMLESLWPDTGNEEKKWMEKNVFNLSHQSKNKWRLIALTQQQK